jgi:HEAT repeat protein
LKGRLLVGAINSLGVRRAIGAVEPLVARLADRDAEVAAAAAVALGRIGNDAATAALRASLASTTGAVRSAVAEGCVLCAERAVSDGRDTLAVELYDQVRTADVPKPRLLEATRGAILARQQAGIPLLVEQLHSPDRDLFRLALSTAREFPGNQIDATLAEQLKKVPPDRAALLIYAMADRPQTVVLSAVLQAAEGGPKPVRLAALSALGRIGNATCLDSLLKIAVEADEEVSRGAKTSLAALPGRDVDQGIVQRLERPERKQYALLVELVGERRIEALPLLLKALEHSDQEVRTAALGSLGHTVPPDRLSILISQVVSPKNPLDAPAAQQALKTASVRMPDREACAEELAAALDRAPAATKVVLLDILGAVGGTKALHTIAAAAKSTDPQLQDVSTKLLGEWMTIDAAPVLLELTTAAPGERFQIRALRGYIRIARQFVMPETERVEMCRRAYEASRAPAERKLVLEVLRRYPNLETFKLAIQATTDFAELKDDAVQTVLAIAPRLGGGNPEIEDLLAQVELPSVRLEIVKGEYGAGPNQQDVTDILRAAAGDVQWIRLPAASYNDAFGGDPAPGAPKRLRVQYRLNDKSAEATFPENALVVLPLPK